MTDARCSCLQIPPRENWFQYVHRVYTTAINFPVHDKIGLDTLDTLQCDRNVAFRAQWTLT